MFDPRSILDAIVKGNGASPERAPGARDTDLGAIGDLLKQIAGGDDTGSSPAQSRRTRMAPPPTETETDTSTSTRDPAPEEEEVPPRRPRTAKRKSADEDTDAGPGAASGGGLEDIIRDVLGGQGGGGLKDILDKVNQKGGLGDVLGPVLGQIFGQKGGGARLADVPEGAGAAASGPGDALADRIKALAGGRSPEELMAAVKAVIANNQFGAGMAAGGLGALVLGTRTGRSLAASAAKLGGLAVIGGLAYKAYTNYQQGAAATPDSLAHPRLVAPPAGSGFEAATVSQDLATTMLRAMVAAAAADGRIDPGEHQKLVAGFGGDAMPQAARDFLAREIAAPASIDAIAADVTSEEAAVQVFTAARITVDPDNVAEHAFLQDLAAALGLDEGLVAHIDAAARGGA